MVDGCKLPCPLTHTFTDQYGQFLLGPLCPNRKYMLKVYKDNIQVKYVPLNVSCYDGTCIGVNPNNSNSNCSCQENKCNCECDC